MKKKNKFIFTTSPESANILRQMGYVQISSGGDSWVFLNNEKITFDHLKDTTFTNKICT